MLAALGSDHCQQRAHHRCPFMADSGLSGPRRQLFECGEIVGLCGEGQVFLNPCDYDVHPCALVGYCELQRPIAQC